MNTTREKARSRGRSGSSPERLGVRGAFTIIELMVVVGIMFVLIAVTLPALRSMMRSNNQKESANELTAMVATAHSLAVQSHQPAGVIIYEDTSAKNQSAAQLVVASTSTQTSISLLRAPQTSPQSLPKGIKVATLDDATADSNIKSSDSATVSCRLIMFDGNGQLMLRSGFTSSDTNASMWNILSGTPASSPGFVVYDGNVFKAANVATDPASVGAWMKQNADVLIINAYTGNVIR